MVLVLALIEMRTFVLDHPDDQITPIVQKGCDYVLGQLKRTIKIAKVGKQQDLNAQKEFQARSQVEQKNVGLTTADEFGK